MKKDTEKSDVEKIWTTTTKKWKIELNLKNCV